MATECSLLALDFCLMEQTPVLTDEGEKPIEHITTGMGVVSCDHGTKVCMEKVIKGACYIGALPAVLVRTDDGSTAVCTPDHTWMKYDGTMARADDLKPGDRLAHVKNGYSGRYPTWYIRNNRNYAKKHKLVSQFVHGVAPAGFHVDHIDGNIEHWHSHNLRLLSAYENRAQGGKRYWGAVKNGDKSDKNRLEGLRIGLKSRRSYVGDGNPNYGKRNGSIVTCPVCGKEFYNHPSQHRKFCSCKCYHGSRKTNHKVVSVEQLPGLHRMYQLTVENTHNYVLPNGMVSGNSQIELRVAAHESQDPTMLDIYWNDGDIHMTTACAMFSLPPEKIDDKAHRRPAKTCNFGTIYLISAKGLWAQFQHEGLTEFTEGDCQDFLDSWRHTYPGFFDWVEEVKAEARRTGMVRDMFGRVRWVPELRSSLKYVREAGIRQAVNAPIQSGAGGILKHAIRNLTPIIRQWTEVYHVVCRPILQVHDELIFEVEDEYLPIMAPQFHGIMCSAVELDVPVKVDCEVGKNWKELEEYPL